MLHVQQHRAAIIDQRPPVTADQPLSQPQRARRQVKGGRRAMQIASIGLPWPPGIGRAYASEGNFQVLGGERPILMLIAQHEGVSR